MKWCDSEEPKTQDLWLSQFALIVNSMKPFWSTADWKVKRPPSASLPVPTAPYPGGCARFAPGLRPLVVEDLAPGDPHGLAPLLLA